MYHRCARFFYLFYGISEAPSMGVNSSMYTRISSFAAHIAITARVASNEIRMHTFTSLLNANAAAAYLNFIYLFLAFLLLLYFFFLFC